MSLPRARLSRMLARMSSFLRVLMRVVVRCGTWQPAPRRRRLQRRPRRSRRTPNLVTQGIPPIPMSLVREVEKYTDFRGHSFVDWHPLRREMLVAHRRAGASTAQLFRLRAPMAELEPLTQFSRSGRRARATSRTRAGTSCSRAAAAATRPTSCTGSISTAARSRSSPTPTSATAWPAGCTGSWPTGRRCSSSRAARSHRAGRQPRRRCTRPCG